MTPIAAFWSLTAHEGSRQRVAHEKLLHSMAATFDRCHRLQHDTRVFGTPAASRPASAAVAGGGCVSGGCEIADEAAILR